MSSTKSSRDSFRVVIRMRPPLPREINNNYVNCVGVDKTSIITISEDGYNSHRFTFDIVFGEDSSQSQVYNMSARPGVLSVLEGYNASVIAYGQTSSGKTFTMEGGDDMKLSIHDHKKLQSHPERGIIPRATEEIFNYIQTKGNSKTKFLVRASYLQIYNDVISDLLKPERTNLSIREDKKKGVFVDGLSEWVVRSPYEIYGLMERGAQVRATGSTKMNELSSRSHAVFIIICEQSETTIIDDSGREIDIDTFQQLKDEGKHLDMKGELRQTFKIGKLNLVDLAGSERVKFSGATGSRLKESQKINQSLTALGIVIAALTDPKGRNHIPYRNSKLTRLLEDSLGGNCKTTMMAMISPALESFSESVSTLKFAHRAKSIKNDPHINEDLDHRALLRKYEREIKKLRAQLNTRPQGPEIDKQVLTQIETQARRAEEDKMAAITALEKRSREFMHEKQEKRKLEEKIALLQSQLLVGGEKIEETPAFQNLLKKEYARVQKEFQNKLHDLERERVSIEDEKKQVDRYKQLLLKQRDIMIALTARLNERDESILALQEELEAYDAHQRMLEETLDLKTSALIHYQNELQQLQNRSQHENGQSITSDVEKQQNIIIQRQRAQIEQLQQESKFRKLEAPDVDIKKINTNVQLLVKLQNMTITKEEDRIRKDRLVQEVLRQLLKETSVLNASNS